MVANVTCVVFLSAKHSYTAIGCALTEATRDLLLIQISCNRPKTLHYKISLTFRSLFFKLLLYDDSHIPPDESYISILFREADLVRFMGILG